MISPNANEQKSATAEAAVIGAAVLSEVCAGSVFTLLAAEDFLVQAYADAFARLQLLWRRDGRIDTATIGRLPCRDIVLRCAETVPSIQEAACLTYIRHVSDAARVRRAQAVAAAIVTGDMEPDAMLEACAAMEKALGGVREAGWEDAKQGFEGFYARQRGGAPEYVKCGVFPHFDRHTFIRPGDLILVGGRPSAGKTMASLNLALGWARRGQRVAYFSLETSPDKIWDRLIAAEFGLSFAEVKRGEVATDDGELQQDAAQFARLPIYVCQAAGRSVAWMRAQTARLQADIAVVDYVQLIRGKGDSRYEAVTQISIDLHEWAQSDKVVVVGLCQLSRQGSEAPRLSDLRESGQLEQDADVVILLNKKTDPETGHTDYTLDIAKNKEGITGELKMFFDGERQRLRELADAETTPDAPAGFREVTEPLPGPVQQKFYP